MLPRSFFSSPLGRRGVRVRGPWTVTRRGQPHPVLHDDSSPAPSCPDRHLQLATRGCPPPLGKCSAALRISHTAHRPGCCYPPLPSASPSCDRRHAGPPADSRGLRPRALLRPPRQKGGEAVAGPVGSVGNAQRFPRRSWAAVGKRRAARDHRPCSAELVHRCPHRRHCPQAPHPRPATPRCESVHHTSRPTPTRPRPHARRHGTRPPQLPITSASLRPHRRRISRLTRLTR